VDEVMAAERPAIEKLQSHLGVLLEHLAKYEQVHRLLFEDEAAHTLLQSSERRTIEAATQQLAALFRQGMEEGVFRPSDPVMFGRMYLGLCRGVLQSHPGLKDPSRRESIQCLIVNTFLNGIATENGRTG